MGDAKNMMSSKQTKIDSVLIANRGEIACRIIKTVKSLGLRAVAVYSDADKDALHVKLADQACHIGPSPATESYLNIGKILEAAKASGTTAIHPGYGFLSENADFAQACCNANIIFIGPKPHAIEVMGDKAKAKRLMLESDVPCIPGYQDVEQSEDALIKASKTIGFPIMVKAAAGGGGRGMRLVTAAKDLPAAIKTARSEALNAFGSDVLILERAIQNPRHVEIQIVADRHGQILHLGERDCSVQRRHQKVIEESPCPIITPEIRTKMGKAAIKAAQIVGYEGVGTVEFIMDDTGSFFFLEMNTRLQVEHPVTELVTGLDLVALQISVAQGDPLSLKQDDIQLSGHAIEARLYAEDPTKSFLPVTGSVLHYSPARGDGIRTDSGIGTQQEITPFYDPMIAKVIAHGETRDIARRRLVKALRETQLYGISTNQSFLIDCLEQEDFISGEAKTDFIGKNFPPKTLRPLTLTPEIGVIAASLQYELLYHTAKSIALPLSEEFKGWFSAKTISSSFKYEIGDTSINVDIYPLSTTTLNVVVNEQSYAVTIEDLQNNQATLLINGHRKHVGYFAVGEERLIFSEDGRTYDLTNKLATYAQEMSPHGKGIIQAPMHGSLVEIRVSEGQIVSKGQCLAVLEAMKMQHEIISDVKGVVSSVSSQIGQQVAADTTLFVIQEATNAKTHW